MLELFGFDCYSPKEIAERVENIGVTKANLPLLSMSALGVLAGGFIGLGGMFFTLVLSDASLSFAAARVLGGVAFSLGLILVVVAGAELFTGNNLLVMAWVSGRVSTARLAELQATTACLSAIVVMQVVNVFLCRSRSESTFSFGLLNNPLLLLGILIELTIILLIDYTPWGNVVFGTAPIPFVVWLFVVPFALGMLMLEESRKWFIRIFTARHESRDFASAAISHHEHARV